MKHHINFPLRKLYIQQRYTTTFFDWLHFIEHSHFFFFCILFKIWGIKNETSSLNQINRTLMMAK